MTTPVIAVLISLPVFENVHVNAKLVKLLTLQGLLLDKQYDFCFAMSMADVLTDIPELISQALEKNDEVQAVALDIPKTFGCIWYAGLLCKMSATSVQQEIFCRRTCHEVIS